MNNPYNFDPSNPIFNQLGGFNNFMSNFNSFQQQFNQCAQMTPQQIIQQKLQSGEITQDQFNAVAQRANQMMGFFGGGKR